MNTMKKTFTLIILQMITGIIAGVLFIACNSRSDGKEKDNDQQIESLIQVNRINEKVVLVTFGGEAVTAVNTGKGIVMIDAGISTGLTGRYRKLIEKEFHSTDFAILIITHGHHDHFGGNGVFNDAKIIAHENCIKAIESRWNDPEKVKSNLVKIIGEYNNAMDTLEKGSAVWIENFMLRTRFHFAYEDIMNNWPAKMPDITFSDTMRIDMGDLTFNMIWFGKAHSESDILIHIPELNMMFTGDLFSSYGRPSLADDKITDTVSVSDALVWIEARLDKIDIIIGGHGQILSKDDLKSFLRKTSNLLN